MKAISTFLRPSSAKRWIECPGSIRLCESLPPGPQPEPGEAARRGTLGHLLIELSLRLDLPVETIAEQLDVRDTELVLAAKEIAREVTTFITPTGTVLIEQRFDILDGLVSGTADLTIVDSTAAVLADYKFGAMPIDVEDPQFTLYGSGILERFPHVDRVTVIVAQPFAPHVDGPWRSRQLDRANLKMEMVVVERAIALAQQPDAPLSAGGHCRFCPARGICPALTEFAIAAARDSFPDPADMAPETALAWRLDMAPALDAWAESQNEIALARLQQGHDVPGYALGQARGSRRWKEDEREIVDLLVGLGFDPDQIAPRRLVSPAAVEAMLRSKGLPAKEIAGLWSRFEGPLKVVPANDPSTMPERVEWGQPTLVEDF